MSNLVDDSRKLDGVFFIQCCECVCTILDNDDSVPAFFEQTYSQLLIDPVVLRQ